MAKQSNIHYLPLAASVMLLISFISSGVSAADSQVDPHIQAAHMLQPPITWTDSTKGTQPSEHGAPQSLVPQEQAGRVLQPLPPVTARPMGMARTNQR
jgi:hypothetical protein